MERLWAALLAASAIACQSTPPSQPMDDPPADEPIVALPPPPDPQAIEEDEERRIAERVLASRVEALERETLARRLLDEADLAAREGRSDEARARLRHVLELEVPPELRDEASVALAALDAVPRVQRAAVPGPVRPRADLQRRASISEIHTLLEEGRIRTGRGDFDGAFERLDRAEAILRHLPYDEPRDVLDPDVSDLRRTGPASSAEAEALESRRYRASGCGH